MNTVDPRPSQPDLEEILQENGDGQKNQRVLTVIALIAAVLIFGGLLLWLHYRQTGNGKPTYVSEQIQRDNIKLIVTATGNLEPTDQVTIGSEISGIVKEVYVDYNDVVSKDQAIARIDTSELEQQIAVARATIASAEARVYHANVTLKETKAALKRYDELLKISGGRTPSRADYELVEANAERAQAELHTAQASVDEANAQLKTHEIRLAKAVIKSPVDGIVLTRKVEPGQTVVASFQAPELFVIARDLKKMKVTVAVAEADIGRIKKDNKVRFTVDTWPTRHYDASVTKVSYGATIANNVVTYDTELNVNNSDLSLRPGMTAVADIEVDEHPSVLVVPTMALRYDPSRSEAPVAPKKGILENLLPGPRRRTERRASDLANASRPRVLEDGTAQLWILRKGQPVPVTVRVGLSNGRYTEVAGDEITEGIEVIIR